MYKTKGKITFYKWVSLPAVAIAFFLFTELFSANPEFIERHYSQGLYPIIARIISNVSGFFPFSIDDIFYTLLIVFVFCLLGLWLFKKLKFKYVILYILNGLASVYILFYLLWGFNYYRVHLSDRLQLNAHNVTQAEFISITKNLIDSCNTLQCTFETLNENEADSLIEESYKKLSTVLHINYPMGKRKDKKITFSTFYAKTGISGYFGPFFNEVHVNKKITSIEYPFVLAHEKAHQFGITSEAEANFYAWMACSFSPSKQLKYSANLMVLQHFLTQAYSLPEYEELVKQINKPVKDDILFIRQHWLSLRNETLDKAATKVNDAYLKTNKVKGGIKDYYGVVEHVMNFSLDSAFQKKTQPAHQIK